MERRNVNSAATLQMAAATKAISLPSYGHPRRHWNDKSARTLASSLFLEVRVSHLVVEVSHAPQDDRYEENYVGGEDVDISEGEPSLKYPAAVVCSPVPTQDFCFFWVFDRNLFCSHR